MASKCLREESAASFAQPVRADGLGPSKRSEGRRTNENFPWSVLLTRRMLAQGLHSGNGSPVRRRTAARKSLEQVRIARTSTANAQVQTSSRPFLVRFAVVAAVGGSDSNSNVDSIVLTCLSVDLCLGITPARLPLQFCHPADCKKKQTDEQLARRCCRPSGGLIWTRTTKT